MINIDIEEVRKYIAQNCLDHVRHGKGNLVFNTFTGSGKTTTVLDTIYKSEDGFTWMYFAPYHKVIEENIELSKVFDIHDFVHLESREKLCLSKDYKELAKKGINITPFCENLCPFKDKKCPYYENLKRIREKPTCFAGVHAHIPTLLQTLLYEKWARRCLFNYYDVIIIDEFPSNTIYNQLAINKFDIDYARDILAMTGITSNETHVLKMILDNLSLSTASIGINHAKIHSMLGLKKLDFDKFKEDYDRELLSLILSKKIRSPPKDIIHSLIEIYSRKPTLKELKWMIYKTISDPWHKSMIYLTVSNMPSFKTLPIKVIALDGTADLPSWKNVLGEDTKSISFDIEYKNAYQLIGSRNPITTIMNKNELSPSGHRMFEVLKNICEYKKEKVLICASKRVQRVLKKEFKKVGIDNYVFATYFNLRSRNSYYEECDTCVLFHEPNIPPFQAEIIKHVLGWDQFIVRKIHREDEMKQGVGRLRQNIEETPNSRLRGLREIFIFSSTGYKKLFPEAKYMFYDDMLSYVRGGKKRLFFERLEKALQKKSLTRTELGKMLGMSQSRIRRILNILEDEGVVELEWGKIKYIKKIKEEKFLIKLGRSF